MNGMRFVQFVQHFRLIAYMDVFSIPTGKPVHKLHKAHFLLNGMHICAVNAALPVNRLYDHFRHTDRETSAQSAFFFTRAPMARARGAINGKRRIKCIVHFSKQPGMCRDATRAAPGYCLRRHTNRLAGFRPDAMRGVLDRWSMGPCCASPHGAARARFRCSHAMSTVVSNSLSINSLSDI